MIYAVMPEMVCAPHEGENMQYAGIIIHCFPLKEPQDHRTGPGATQTTHEKSLKFV